MVGGLTLLGDGGPPADVSSLSPPSFAMILGARKPPMVDLSPTDHRSFRKDGKPAIEFGPKDYDRGIEHMKSVVVLKFSGAYRPTLADIRATISKSWGVIGDFSLGTIDRKHVLLRFENESEVTKALSRVNNQIKGSWFRTFRWSPAFDLSMDPCFAPIWVELPSLPLEFYHPALLRAIGDQLGTFLSIDQEFLDRFCECSGQKINADKCSFMMHSSIPSSVVQVVEAITGFQRKPAVMTYLGAPICAGREAHHDQACPVEHGHIYNCGGGSS
ncbi:protein of unknown function DUF4283 [Macleaya cordata]|uniref:DUF4283 domain-containing protein n=1 Tax=Macleaya cordata TaxID=56857 RepID=A0A200QEA1_MACCD|nr:protein of unknown function DUF4283 [Macleaya cordata]